MSGDPKGSALLVGFGEATACFAAIVSLGSATVPPASVFFFQKNMHSLLK